MLFLVDIFCFFIIMKHKGECYFQYFTNIMCLELFGNAFTLCMFVFFFLKKKKKKIQKKVIHWYYSTGNTENTLIWIIVFVAYLLQSSLD
jgi:hypothetical protein